MTQWYPIALTSNQTTNLRSIRLLNQDLFLWRSHDGVVVGIDRCPHRGAKLSLGWISEDCLVCPYHGLIYDKTGHCSLIPAHPDLIPSQKLHIHRLPIQQHYGLIWTTLASSSQDLPIFPQFQDEQYRNILCGPYYYKASAYRAMENFLDVSHFPYVHEGLLGDRSYPVIKPYTVTINSKGIETSAIEILQPDPDGLGKESFVKYYYQVHRPLIASFTKITAAGEFFMFLALTPLSDVECIAWMGLAMNYGYDIPETEIKAFQDKLVAQDIKIVETQSPLVPSLNWVDEYPLPSDKLVVAYRKWLGSKSDSKESF
ncbi:aromatic ring-hydroxylating dioxygenase subunit alpha [Aphanothece hegewaldii CCALA 016]|uniref:Aromatic ring-hydroxylating dioxygenase subunit alpha n=1 Tax=Aphanothece hegewaldii CCALA 016 TaxID=2107694 RepID=A0A2T1M0T9_9CHRO|nr:aromatic ring-hydroxylating dioxygenase subunit alpha [Aphanothece hegewaldii]PSF38292.1 aromatic ring-hydroxylating dioxygenase subunit alpha [Aphanothece hegewaldii CCALA 016]